MKKKKYYTEKLTYKSVLFWNGSEFCINQLRSDDRCTQYDEWNRYVKSITPRNWQIGQKLCENKPTPLVSLRNVLANLVVRETVADVTGRFI